MEIAGKKKLERSDQRLFNKTDAYFRDLKHGTAHAATIFLINRAAGPPPEDDKRISILPFAPKRNKMGVVTGVTLNEFDPNTHTLLSTDAAMHIGAKELARRRLFPHDPMEFMRLCEIASDGEEDFKFLQKVWKLLGKKFFLRQTSYGEPEKVRHIQREAGSGNGDEEDEEDKPTMQEWHQEQWHNEGETISESERAAKILMTGRRLELDAVSLSDRMLSRTCTWSWTPQDPPNELTCSQRRSMIDAKAAIVAAIRACGGIYVTEYAHGDIMGDTVPLVSVLKESIGKPVEAEDDDPENVLRRHAKTAKEKLIRKEKSRKRKMDRDLYTGETKRSKEDSSSCENKKSGFMNIIHVEMTHDEILEAAEKNKYAIWREYKRLMSKLKMRRERRERLREELFCYNATVAESEQVVIPHCFDPRVDVFADS